MPVPSFLTVHFLSLLLLALVLGVYIIYGFIIIYHLIRFGVGSAPKFAAIVFFLGSVVLVMIVIGLYSTLNLQITLQKFPAIHLPDPLNITIPGSTL